MLNSLSSRWQTLKTKYKKFIPFIFTFIFCFNPLTVFATNIPLSSVPYSNTTWTDMRFRVNSSGSWSNYYLAEYNTSEYYTNFTDTVVFSGVSRFLYGFNNNTAGFEYPFNFEAFDYYLAFNYMSYGSNYTQSNYDVSHLRLDGYDINNNFAYFDLPTVDISSFSQNNSRGFSILSKIPDNISINLSNQIMVIFSSPTILCLPANVSAFVYQVPKYTSEDSVSSIVNAINNQTDFIVNGDSSTGGIVSGADSSKSELESIVSEYHEIENSMLDNFTLYQDEILVDLRGWSWGGLRSCAKWVGDTLTDYYNNLGDFKQYIIYPLLLGIALFFIGRGSSIIGHLYRKPTVTTTYTESTSTRYRSGNHSGTNTSTTTYREGGVLRK